MYSISNNDALYLFGALFTAISLLMRNILYLRISYLIASFIYTIYGIQVNIPSIVGTSIIFLAINTYSTTVLLLSMKKTWLPENLARIHDIYKSIINTASFRNLIRQAKQEYLTNTTLIIEGQAVPELMLLIEGRVDIIIGEKLVTTLEPGSFIGEFSTLSGDAASATVLCHDTIKVAKWENSQVQYKEDLKQMISFNLLQKLTNTNNPSVYKAFTSSEKYQDLIGQSERKHYCDERIINEGALIIELLLILEGEVDIIKKDTVITSLGKGEFLGEFGILTGHKASASVDCKGSLTVASWTKAQVMENEILRNMISVNLSQKLTDTSSFAAHLQSSPTPSFILSDTLTQLVELGEKAMYNNEVFIEKGDIIKEIILITEGNVDILVDGKCVTTLSEGNFLGEFGLLIGKRSDASAYSNGKVEVVKWSKQQLDELDDLKQLISLNLNLNLNFTHKLTGIHTHSEIKNSFSSSEMKKLLESASKKKFQEEFLVKEGEYLNNLYYILEGRIYLFKDNKYIVSLDAGNFIGEYALLKEIAVTHSAYCSDKVEVAFWSKEQLSENQELKQLIRDNLAKKIIEIE